MHTRFQLPRIGSFWSLAQGRINTFSISLIIGTVIGFTAGIFAASIQYVDTKRAYQAQIQELMQQVSECDQSIDHRELSSAGKPAYTDTGDGILAINY